MFVFFEPVGEYYAHVVFIYVHIISPMEYYVLAEFNLQMQQNSD